MKWDKYYNLPEIEEVRKKITETYSNNLVFIEETHQYFLNGEEMECVSNITHRFKATNSEQMAENCVKKWQRDQNPSYKYYGMSKEEILAQWAVKSGRACEFGTDVHAFGESMFYYMTEQYDKILPECVDKFKNGQPCPTNMHEEAVVKFWNDIPENMVPLLAETKVFNRNGTNYAGTYDINYYYVDKPESPKNGIVIFDYKGLDINTPIITKNGWKTMGTVEVGDIVYDENGEETKVLHTSDVHNNKCYKIKFNNNTEVIADKDHRWKIVFLRSLKGKKKELVMTTEEIAEFIKMHPNRKNLQNIPRISHNQAIKGEEKELLIDPYVLGVWLGDGDSNCGAITNMYNEIFEEIKSRGYEIGQDISKGGSGKATKHTIIGLASKLKKLNLLKNKHIPIEYLTASVEQKYQLLGGLMDTDGYYNKTRKRYVFATTREKQADFCVELLSSLGIKSTKIRCKKYCKNKTFNGFDVCFSVKKNLFIKRKVETIEFESFPYINILSVEETNTVPTRCIEVDSKKHTFLFGQNMMISHNTNKELYSDYSRSRNGRCLWPFNDMYDESASYYTIQLGLYQIPMENIGLKVLGRRIIWLKPDGNYEKISIPNIADKIRTALDIPTAEEIISKKIL